jgi:N-acetylmuramic acid 6-phosphate (MurNAc-6-P) etherase
MVKLGKTYGNLMVDVLPRSSKLRDRAKRIVMRDRGCGRAGGGGAAQEVRLGR